MTDSKLISDNEIIAKKWFIDIWTNEDFKKAKEIIHEKYAPESIQIPKIGPEQVIHEVKYFRSIFPDLKYSITEMILKKIKFG